MGAVVNDIERAVTEHIYSEGPSGVKPSLRTGQL